jgi:asparagine synthetase B (glutamine-hydrolysing)
MCGVCWIVVDGIPVQVDVSKVPDETARENLHWSIDDEKHQDSMIPDSIINTLSRRGPDAMNIASLKHPDTNRTISQVAAAVLHIRGDSGSPTPQPILSPDSKDMLCWNGEIFGGLDQFDEAQNDGLQLFKALVQCGTDVESIRNVISKLEGPFAIMFWNARLQTMFVARDKMGRRSLVFSFPQVQDGEPLMTSRFCISSVAESEPKGKWREFPVSGIFQMHLSAELLRITLMPWDVFVDPLKFARAEVSSPAEMFKLLFDAPSSSLNVSPFNVQPSSNQASVEGFVKHLGDSVAKRVLCITRINAEHDSAKIGVLYSGGIDSLLIAALADKFVPIEEPIDLLNIAFGVNPYNAPDRQTGINGFLELKRLNPKRKWKFVEINIQVDDVHNARKRVEQLLHPASTVMDFNIGSALWSAARGSGVIAESDEVYQPIESAATRYASTEEETTDTPIIETKSFEDVSKRIPYVSKARILLSGLGADELLGGYGRHRTAFRRGGLETLGQEMQKDVCRIWRRNLGRDDRLMSDHGREVRFPFLDENFMKYILSSPLEQLVDFSFPAGIGDKKILREAAQMVGIDKKFASLEKRAIQFGTKIANKNVAGYVPLTDDIKTSEIVQSAENIQVAKGKLNKKANKRNGKPGFE